MQSGTTGRRLRLAASAATALALTATACGSSSGSSAAGGSGGTGGSKVTVHLGYFPNITHGVALVGVHQGIFAKALGADTLDASQTFSAGPAENQALLSGSIDIAFEGPSSALSAYTSSHGAVEIISGAASGGAGLVTKASITSASQLKGTTLGSPQLGNTQDVALRTWLTSQGLTSTTTGGGDVSVQPSSTGSGTVVTEFKAGQIAGAWMPEPYEAEMLADGGHLLVNEASLWPGGQFATTDIVVRKAFAEADPAAVTAFLQGVLDTLSYIAANPAAAQSEANAQLASIAGGKTLSTKVLSSAWSQVSFTDDPLESTITKEESDGVATGLVKPVSDLSGIFDLGPLNALLAKDGKPPVATS